MGRAVSATIGARPTSGTTEVKSAMRDETSLRAKRVGLRVALTAVFGAVTGACNVGSDTSESLQTEVRDSAGVMIVENARPATGSRLGWRVGDAAAVSIGVQQGDEAYQLYGVEDATRLSDGRIAVANAGTSEIRFFSADGGHLESWGRVGEGPGEFAQYDPEAVSAWPGDSIIGAAWWRGQVVIFDADGNYGRTATLGEGRFSFVGPLPGGDLLAKPGLPVGMQFGAGGSTLRRQEAEFAVIAPTGEIHASLGTHPGDEWFFSPNSPSARPHPFGRSVLATVWGHLAVVAANDRYEIRAYDRDGILAKIVRRDHELRPPTHAELGAWFTESYADRSEEDQERLRALFEGMTLVEFFPAFSALHSDPLGYIWVQNTNSPNRTRTSGLSSTRPGAFRDSSRRRAISMSSKSARTIFSAAPRTISVWNTSSSGHWIAHPITS